VSGTLDGSPDFQISVSLRKEDRRCRSMPNPSVRSGTSPDHDGGSPEPSSPPQRQNVRVGQCSGMPPERVWVTRGSLGRRPHRLSRLTQLVSPCRGATDGELTLSESALVHVMLHPCRSARCDPNYERSETDCAKSGIYWIRDDLSDKLKAVAASLRRNGEWLGQAARAAGSRPRDRM